MVNAQNTAINTAAANPAGGVNGFVAMNMAQQQGGINPNTLYQMANQNNNTGNSAGSWTCSCGTANTGKFCANCGKPKPAPVGSWTCSCGASNTGKFCAECGKPKPESDGWTCSCGTTNKGKFCSNCGKPKE